MKLYAFYLGGKAQNARLEVHDVAFCVGSTIEECFPTIKSQWFGIKKQLHIDAIMEVNFVDNYEIQITTSLSHNSSPEHNKKLYFIYLGGSKPRDFFEYHKGGFVVAGSQMGAMSRAKSVFKVDFTDKHVDNVMAIDSCINVNKLIKNFHIKLVPCDPSNVKELKITTCYLAVK